MRHVFFDLGHTLEVDGVVRPGALDALAAIAAQHDELGVPPTLGLISDWEEAQTPAEVEGAEHRYLELLQALGLADFFVPFSRAVTLSTQVGVFKPEPQIFRAALDKVDPGASFQSAIFITENPDHVLAARELGLQAIHLKAPDQEVAEVDDFETLVQRVAVLLQSPP